VYTMADIATDPHYLARGVYTGIEGMPMQGLIARLSATPGAVRWNGRAMGADTDSVLQELDRQAATD
jgi:crotonobetainyl-CoA:carnitine CoA-transferase CaiB-like acyl-CoA transferase